MHHRVTPVSRRRLPLDRLSIPTPPREDRIDWSTPIDRSRRFYCDRLTPLYHTPVYTELSDAHRLRYNQLTGLYSNELIGFLETFVLGRTLQALTKRTDLRLPGGLMEALHQFQADEARHADLWKRLNRLSEPEWYRDREYRILSVPRPALAAAEFLAGHPVAFPLVFWIQLVQEERSIDISRRMAGAPAAEIEPRYAAVYGGHLRDEARHVQLDWHLIDLLYAPRRPIMDLDRFKLINETLGHFYGDTVLQEVGRRLQSRLRVNDLVARLGGDEFVIMIDPVDHTNQAGTVAQHIASILERPIMVAGYSAEASASIGIAGYPEHGSSGHTLIKNAEIAMYEAKRHGVNTMVYDPGFDMHDVNRLTILSQLRSAINGHELQVFYQPQFDGTSGGLAGVEALVRWPHSDPEWPLPAEFIELAERGGLINRLNRCVLEIVFDQLAAWQEVGVTTSISTNLSAINLQDPGLFTYIAQGLAARGLNAARLTLEITETAVASDTKAARALVKRLSELGVRLSIDDFGTGYSSLIILRELPVEEIKIDRSFVMNMTRDTNDAVLVRSTIDLAHNLGRAVTAEGVESQEALELLKSWGCDVVQGFFLSPPLAIDDLNRKLANASWHSLTSAFASKI